MEGIPDAMTYIVLIAIAPSLLLILYIYNLDKIEREPVRLLTRLFFLGGLSTVSAMLLEIVGEKLLQSMVPDSTAVRYMILENFLVVALIEEGGKYLAVRFSTWKNKAFNFRFDGVVYCATASLGFAAFENILYVISYGTSIAPTRAVTAIPLHCIAGVFMGHYYGQAKLMEDKGRHNMSVIYTVCSLLVPILIHGCYDFLATAENEFCSYIFLAYIIVLDLVAFRKIRRYSREDKAV